MAIGVPIKNAGELYVNGLELAWASATTLTIASGSARNSTNANDIVLDASVTINGATNGANGLDAGSLANATFYYVYVIASSNSLADAAGLISTSATPSLPANYDMYRRVGFVLTDGSAEFLLFWQNGNDKKRTVWYDVGISELSAGTATSYTAINLATSVPPLATNVIFDIAYTPNSATNTAQFLPYGSSATNGVVRFGCGVAAAQKGQIIVPCELNSAVPTVQYKVSNGSDSLTLLTMGYEDHL